MEVKERDAILGRLDKHFNERNEMLATLTERTEGILGQLERQNDHLSLLNGHLSRHESLIGTNSERITENKTQIVWLLRGLIILGTLLTGSSAWNLFIG